MKDRMSAAQQPYRVLVVDDDPVQRLLVHEILEAPRYIVRAAASCREALALLSCEEPDVLLLDRELPDLSGDELCRRVRCRPELARLPIVMVSGGGTPQDVAASLRAGADDFLRKPYHSLELRTRVDAAARGREPGAIRIAQCALSRHPS
jgi:DNA-binding response OmpR family regulator